MGECLVQAGLITDEGLRAALAEQRRTGERLGIVLTRLKLATETGIAQALAAQLGLPYRDLDERPPDPGVAGCIPRAVALKHAAVAMSLEQHVLTVAMSDPLQLGLVQDLERQTGYRIQQVVATRSGILEALGALAGAEACSPERASTVADLAPATAPATPLPLGTVEIVLGILSSAVSVGASEVHIEPTAQSVVVRERVDGVLRDAVHLPTWAHDEVVASFKRRAGLQAAETRLPQAGRIRHAVENGPESDFRVSTLRTLFGEKVVLRRSDGPGVAASLDDLGFSRTALDEMRAFVSRAHGLVLVVGPTGSGVRTTLAGLAADLASRRAGTGDVVALEDPIEYQIRGVTQIAVDRERGETLGGRLQEVVEHGPDVLVVSELRDLETARIACSAAARMLVVTTFRADDLPSAVTGLLALGVDAGAIAAPLVGVVTQRLVRRLCVTCRRPSTAADLLDRAAFFEPVGCDQCQHTGYRGRIGVSQATAVSAAMREAMTAPDARRRVADLVRQDGGVSLAEDGLAKVSAGVTTLDEVRRVIGAGEVDAIESPRPLCAVCGAAMAPGFLACPACGAAVGSRCAHCGRALQPAWRFCPYCTRRVGAQAGGREGNRGRPRTVLS